MASTDMLNAISALLAPEAPVEQRKMANAYLEQAKRGDVHVMLATAASLTVDHLPIEYQVLGLTWCTEAVKRRWGELSEEERGQMVQMAFQNVSSVCKQGRAAWPLKSKAAVLLSAVIRERGTQAYTEVVPQLIMQASEGPPQAEMACLVLNFISEDLNVFDAVNAEYKRSFLAALTSSVSAVFPFLCEVLQQHFVAAVKAQQEGNADQLAMHSSVISASLGALGTWVEWTPMGRIANSTVLDACAFFLSSSEFQLQGLDVLKQIVHRKRTNEAWDEYCALMDKATALLLAKTAEMGLLGPSGQMPEGLKRELSFEGRLEEFGRRLAAVVVTLADTHYRALTDEGRRMGLLQLLLVFTSHPYLPLSTLTLPCWTQLLREATPSGGSASTGNNACIGAGNNNPSHASGATKAAPPPLQLPLECLRALLTLMSDMLRQLVVLTEGAALGAKEAVATAGGWMKGPPQAPVLPPYFDSYQDWRDFGTNTRSQVKFVIRGVAQLVPEQGLTVVSQFMSTALATAGQAEGGGPLIERTLVLDTATHVLEASVPALLEAAVAAAGTSTSAAVMDGLDALLQMLLAVPGFKEPALAEVHARALEAFIKFIPHRPHLVPPLVAATLRCMAALALDAPGSEPPPAHMTSTWKAGFDARMCLTSVITNMAKAHPATFVPYLQPLADQVAALWSAGQLQEGERVLLWEGLLCASTAAPPEVSSQLVRWLLTPIATEWSQPGWQAKFSTPEAFVQAFLPLHPAPATPDQPGAAPGVHVGARAQRWALYHQLTLLERSLRRAHPGLGKGQDAMAPGAQGTEGAGAAGACNPEQPQIQHPMCEHVDWCLPPVAAILRVLQGLSAADAAGALGPLQGVTAMDEVEKAMRAGEERIMVKGSTAPRCVAGENVIDSRYFVRGLRESCTMILSLVGQYCGPGLWSNTQLAATVVPAILSNTEAVDSNTVRMVLRHVLSIWVSKCPPGPQRGLWVVPLCHGLLPHLSKRLSSSWQQLQQGSTAKGGAVAEEVVADSVLRDLTREFMGTILAIMRPFGAPPLGSQPAATAAGGASKSPPGSGRRKGGGAAAAAESGAAKGGQLPAGPGSVAIATAAAAAGAPAPGSGFGESLFETLLVTDGELAQVVVDCAVDGLCWPDSESVSKAIAACRHLVKLAPSLPGLEGFVCGPMLQAAIFSLVQVFSIELQAELLGLMRQILSAFLPRPAGNTTIMTTLQQVLGLAPEAVQSFVASYNTINSEKDQRHHIKQFVAQAGSDEVRKLLAAVSKISYAPSVPSLVDAPPKIRHVPSEQDAPLQGAIYNAIFNE